MVAAATENEAVTFTGFVYVWLCVVGGGIEERYIIIIYNIYIYRERERERERDRHFKLTWILYRYFCPSYILP